MKENWKGLTLPELFELLEPVPVPQPVSMAPQTAGWILLGLLLLAIVLASIWMAIRHRRKNAYRKQALRELETFSNDAARIAEIVRRTALTAYPRTEVASLHGADWLAFLDRSYNGSGFSAGPGRQIADAPYKQQNTSSDLYDVARTWISTHQANLS
ncbi:DUF4381 domain-containing protein [uncultured Roseibium sp.]|uniref:DUF4381 domain-containing protein n=1 Tax=uncultured Roseibium sp. TaxID=1936171 RepID=UPI00260A85F9|nr:DUF4381 domain-containing protein [uncultured Roseibium sp.]